MAKQTPIEILLIEAESYVIGLLREALTNGPDLSDGKLSDPLVDATVKARERFIKAVAKCREDAGALADVLQAIATLREAARRPSLSQPINPSPMPPYREAMSQED